MANNCFYTMKVVGDRKENIEEFISFMNYTHPSGKHFARIFSADPDPIEENNGRYSTIIVGDCAWSVASCMTERGYYSYSKSDELICLSQATEKLMLIVEIFSQESGMGFAEHMIYSNGSCIVDEVRDYYELWYDPSEFNSIDEYIEAENLDLTPEQIECLEMNDYLPMGGFDEVFTI